MTAAATARQRLHAVEVVVPTVGRRSLARLLGALADGDVWPRRVIVVDDRSDAAQPAERAAPPPLDVAAAAGLEVVVLRSSGRGPAAARNVGWRAAGAPWVAFLDDDVEPPADWASRLGADLRGLGADVAGSQGRVLVPLPSGRAPTDWERNVAGLQAAQWATADLTYRRDVLAAVGGFDERFPRAYREDADLGLRVTAAGYRVVRGAREVVHPVRPADFWVSVRVQAGNADDPFMRALHGPGWRERAGVPPGRRPWHLATTGAALTALIGGASGRRRVAVVGALGWLALVVDFAWRRIAPGPRTVAEVRRMMATSTVLPFAATAHWLRGVVTLPWRLRRPGPDPTTPRKNGRSLRSDRSSASRPAAVLFDRDGTLVHDVPYNGDPHAVAPVRGARAAVARLRDLDVPVAVVSNQSGIARGLLTTEQVAAVNERVDALVGPFDHWAVCPHGPDDACACRKPAPGLIEEAAAALGVPPARCVVIGDIGSDVAAAQAAGAHPILVPTGVTRAEEVAAAPEVAADLPDAVERALRGAPAVAPSPRAVGEPGRGAA